MRHGRTHALGGWFHRGRLGHDQPPRLSASTTTARASTSSRTPSGILSVAGRRLSRRRRRDSRAARRPAAAAGRHGRLQPRLGRGALCPVPGRRSTISSGNLVWAGEREAIVPGVSLLSDRTRRRHARRGSPVARRRRGRHGRRRRASSATRARTTNGWRSRRAGSTRFRTVMTGELFNLLKEHSILGDLLAGRGRRRTRRSGDGVAPRARQRRCCPPSCSRSARGVLLGKAEKEDARLLRQRPVDRHRRAHRPRRRRRRRGHRHGPARAHRASMPRRIDEAGATARRARRRAMLPRRHQANRGEDRNERPSTCCGTISTNAR